MHNRDQGLKLGISLMNGRKTRPKVFKGVHRVKAKGHSYVYAWRGGPKLCGDPLHDPKAAEEFISIKRAYLNPSESTLFSGLVSRFRASPEHQSRAPLWRRECEATHELLCDKFGDADIKFFERRAMRKHVLKLRDEHADRPRQADKIMSELRAILSWAQNRGEIAEHVARRVPALSKPDRSQIIWETSEIEAVSAKLSNEAQAVVLLAAHTGLDLTDLCNLTWSQVGVHDIQGKRAKTRKPFYVPVLPGARAVIETIPRESTQVLLNTLSRPWTPSGFKTSFGRAKKAAGITGKTFKDLRGTACTNFLIAGLTYAETGDAMGWSEANVARIARKYVHREKVASATIARITRGRK